MIAPAAVGCKRLLDGVARATVPGMKLAFELPLAQAEKLREEAKRLGLSPEDLARAALADLLATPDAEFRAAAERILQKNQELYRRLA
jgi:hypothetical protein